MDTPVKNPKLPYWFCSPATCSVLSLCYECLTAWAFLLLSSYSLLYIYISSNLGTFSQFSNSFAILPISLRVFCLHVHFFILSANSFCCSSSFCINTPIFTSSLSSFSIRKKKSSYKGFQELSSRQETFAENVTWWEKSSKHFFFLKFFSHLCYSPFRWRKCM